VVVVFLMIAILTGVKWNLSVDLICTSFMARDGEKFFHVCFELWVSCIEKFLFHSVAQFFIGSLILGELIFLNFLYILVISHLSDVQLAEILSYSVGWLFNLETISFLVQKLFNFM
jgi:hypothetical protein